MVQELVNGKHFHEVVDDTYQIVISWMKHIESQSESQSLIELVPLLFPMYQGIIESMAPCILHDNWLTFDPKK